MQWFHFVGGALATWLYCTAGLYITMRLFKDDGEKPSPFDWFFGAIMWLPAFFVAIPFAIVLHGMGKRYKDLRGGNR